MPSPTVIYHEPTPTSSSLIMQIQQKASIQQSMMQHRNGNMCHQKNLNQFEYEENDEKTHRQRQQFQSYHNNYNNYTQNQQLAISDSQQQADQQTIELRMNNLGNERQETG